MTNRTGFCPLTHGDGSYYTHILGITVDWFIAIIGLPGIITAIYAVRRLVRPDCVTRVFVINLLISDLFQIAITVVFILSRFFDPTSPVFLTLRCLSRVIVRLGITASLGFMICISLERYLSVACPIWYRNQQTVRCSVVTAVCVWAASALYALLDFTFVQDPGKSLDIFSVILLMPALPLMVLIPLTYKALQHCRSIQQGEFRKIIGALALVLGIYMLLFLPFCIRNLYCLVAISHHNLCQNELSLVTTSALLYLSPLADPFLYIFMRRDVRNFLDISLWHRGILRQVVCHGSDRSEEEFRQTAESSVRQTQNMGNSPHDIE